MEEFEGMPMDDGGIMAFIGAYMFFMIIAYIFYGFCYGKIFEKAGKPLWAGFVPIYNYMVALEIIGRPLWWVILLLIPFVNIIVAFIVAIDLAKSFGKDTVYGILIIFFSFIMLPMMAFSSDIQYVGPANSAGGGM